MGAEIEIFQCLQFLPEFVYGGDRPMQYLQENVESVNLFFFNLLTF